MRSLSRPIAACMLLMLTLGILAEEAENKPKKPVTPEEAALKARFDTNVDLVNAMMTPELTAQDYADEGDLRASRGEYDGAAVYLLLSLKLRPNHATTSYNLACTFAAWGQKKPAFRFLKEAAQQGFWGYPALTFDSEWSELRNDPEYKAQAEKIQAQYDKEKLKYPPESTLKAPKEKAPADGWPVMLFLHGYGSKRKDYEATAELAAHSGFIGIAIDAEEVLREGSYRWLLNDIPATHAYLQKVLDQYKDQGLNRKKVYLCGFSQGAKYAAGLLAQYPEFYAGGIANSPGGMVQLPKDLKAPERQRPLCLLYGDKEGEHIYEVSKSVESLWTTAKQPLKQQKYEGGHHFPKDWKTLFPTLLEWLQKPAP